MSLALLGFSFFSEISYQRLLRLQNKYKDLLIAWQELSAGDLRMLGVLPKSIEEIILTKKKINLNEYHEKLLQENIQCIDIFSLEYPALLKEIYDPPIVLYKKGELSLQGCEGLAVVGTRHPTSYGVTVTKQLIPELQGFTIVSGLAAGIDTVAHRAALDHGLPTIAVMGTGLDTVYPYENKKLFEQIVTEGAVLSEYPLGSKPMKWHFPRRNRIITGLSRTVVVVEGSVTSGAILSGKIALDQDRNVYAVPGNISSEKSTGTNWLIGQGAAPVCSIEQFSREIRLGQQLQFPIQAPVIELTDLEEKIMACLPLNQAVDTDMVIEQSGCSFTDVVQGLLSLELKRAVTQLPGKRIVRVG
jgi:DNA processing protein